MIFSHAPGHGELLHGVDLVVVGKTLCAGPRRRRVVALNGLEIY